MRDTVVPVLELCLKNLLLQIPPGRVATPGDLAEALGDRLAAKWIGHYVLHHDVESNCVCHRIVRAGGALGGYAHGSTAAKAKLLRAEGVAVRRETVALERFAFREFVSERPLVRLREIQEKIRGGIVLQWPGKRVLPPLVGGVDVGYPRPGMARAAYALVESVSGELVWSASIQRPVEFPFISSYLSFREIPIYLDLLDEVRAAGRLAELVMVDGTGVLHQRGAGVASHLGVVADLATIGVTKTMHRGEADLKDMAPGESRPVLLHGRLTGAALRPTAGSRRPIFISPGNGLDLAFAEQAVRGLLFGRRLPAPIYWADRLTKAPRR
jgi:deoxyribonuclease V